LKIILYLIRQPFRLPPSPEGKAPVIDVVATGTTSSCRLHNPYLGRTGSDFSVGSDCLNAVKAGPSRMLLNKYAESSAVGLPGAGKWTALFYEEGV